MIFTSFYRRRIREQFAGETAHLDIYSIIIILLIKFIFFIYVLLFYILKVRKETTFA
jgi:hypothetical protein